MHGLLVEILSRVGEHFNWKKKHSSELHIVSYVVVL